MEPQLLDPFANSVAYTGVLRARIDGYGNKSKTTPSEDSKNFRSALELLNNFNGRQFRYVGVEYLKIVQFVVKQAHRAKMVRHMRNIPDCPTAH
jgi:hypothetical protein